MVEADPDGPAVVVDHPGVEVLGGLEGTLGYLHRRWVTHFGVVLDQELSAGTPPGRETLARVGRRVRAEQPGLTRILDHHATHPAVREGEDHHRRLVISATAGPTEGVERVALPRETVVPGLPPVAVPGTLGTAVEGIWYDAYVHSDDIRDALGRPSDRCAGLWAAVSHLVDLLEDRGWGPATLELDGMEPIPVRGGGTVVRGNPLIFVLVATGRAHPIELGLDQTVNVYA